MTPQDAITKLVERFPEKYISIKGEISSIFLWGERQETNRSITVYVEGSKGNHYSASTLESAVNLCLLDNQESEPNNEAEQIIAAVEQPEVTYPEMTVKEV